MKLDVKRMGRDIAAVLAAVAAWLGGRPFKVQVRKPRTSRKVSPWRPVLYLDGRPSGHTYRVK